MQKTKLVQVLGRLEKREVGELRKFLNSPFFNTREDVRRLYEILLQGLKKTKALTKEGIYGQLFPKQSYSDRDFHLLMSYLFKLVEKYLAVREFLQDDFEVKAQLMKSYRHRHLPGHFQYIVGRMRRLLDQEEVEDSTYYERYRDIYWEEYQMKVASHPSHKLYLEELTKTTDIAFFAQKMRQICLLTAQRSIYKIDYPLAAQLPFFDYLQEQELTKIPAIGIYFHGYHLLEGSEGESHFPLFKEFLLTHNHKFSLTETRELYLMAVNFCVRQVNEGNRSYFREMFELYRRGLELQVLMENGQLSRFTYHNAVASAIQIEAFDWARKLIVEYRDHLEEPHRDSSYRFNLARLEYEQQNYSEALDLIGGIHFQDLLVNLAAKAIILKIYYQLSEYNLLEAHLNAMNNFIRRKRVLGYHKENYLNIIRYTKKIMAINQYDKSAVQNLSKEISAEEKLTEKRWLLQQLTEL